MLTGLWKNITGNGRISELCVNISVGAQNFDSLLWFDSQNVSLFKISNDVSLFA